MNKAYATLAAALMLSASAFQANACTTSTPLTLPDVVAGISPAGTVLDGSADCSDVSARLARQLDDALSNTLAVSAAHPNLYLSDSENFSVSTSLGFAEDATAVGFGGTMRLDKNWSAFASGAMSTDDSSIWSGSVGARVGF